MRKEFLTTALKSIMSEHLVRAFLCGALLMTGFVDALPTSMEKMTVSSMRKADLESSATGYIYDSQRGQPASYVQYTNHGGYYQPPSQVQYVTYGKPQGSLHHGPTLISAAPAYSQVLAPQSRYLLPGVEDVPKRAPLAPYYIPSRVAEQPVHLEVEEEDDRGIHEDEEEGGYNDDVRENIEDNNEDEEGEYGDGEESHSEAESEHGEKGLEGYESEHKFGKGEKEEHEKDKHEGHYEVKGGHKKAHLDTAGKYGQHDESEKTREDESFGQKDYHKKGHKTTGFHNIYSKDEYKKETDFYDDDHKSGRFDKHSSSDGHHSAAEGDYQKGDSHNSAYEEDNKGEAGYHDKGHDDSQKESYRNEKGVDSYHKDHTDYATSKAAEGDKKYGYHRHE